MHKYTCEGRFHKYSSRETTFFEVYHLKASKSGSKTLPREAGKKNDEFTAGGGFTTPRSTTVLLGGGRSNPPGRTVDFLGEGGRKIRFHIATYDTNKDFRYG